MNPASPVVINHETGNAISCGTIATPRAQDRRLASALPSWKSSTATAAVIAVKTAASPASAGLPIVTSTICTHVSTANAADWIHNNNTASRSGRGPSSSGDKEDASRPGLRWVAGSLTATSLPAGTVADMRALLVVNPHATTTSPRTRDVLTHALNSEVSLSVAHTDHRGHAAQLTTEAVRSGAELVVALGGDGTVNEVANGLLAARSFLKNDVPLPALGVVPGGSTNVFARALGLSGEPVDATGVLLEAIREQRSRTVGLGQVGDRFFTFCAGFGFDAEVVRRVEQARKQGKTATHGRYVRAALAQFALAKDRGAPSIRFTDAATPDNAIELGLSLVQNTSPWSYLGGRELQPSPQASFVTGLDITGVRRLGLVPTMKTALQLLITGRTRGRAVFQRHDLETFTLSASKPLAFQVDGDYLGERDSLTFHSIPDALRVMV